MRKIAKIEKEYLVYIKGDAEPITLSDKDGSMLGKVLLSEVCPNFLKIKGTIYNRFQIEKVEERQVEISAERADALAEMENIARILKNKP